MKTYKFIMSLIGAFLFIVGLFVAMKLNLRIIGTLLMGAGLILFFIGVIGKDEGEMLDENDE